MKARLLLGFSFFMVFQITVSTAQDAKWEDSPRLVPRVTQEMQSPDFWINRIQNPDKIIMTPAQIDNLNARNRNLPEIIKDIDGKDCTINDIMNYKLAIGLQFNVAEPLKIKSFPGDSLRAMLNRHKTMLDGRTWYDRRHMKYEKEVKDALYRRYEYPWGFG